MLYCLVVKAVFELKFSALTAHITVQHLVAFLKVYLFLLSKESYSLKIVNCYILFYGGQTSQRRNMKLRLSCLN